MQRDMDLVRDILVNAAGASGQFDAMSMASNEEERQLIGYHVEIMEQAGLVAASLTKALGGTYVIACVKGLTWAGNDLLSAISNDSVWKKVKVKVAQRAGEATFDIIKAMATTELNALLT